MKTPHIFTSLTVKKKWLGQGKSALVERNDGMVSLIYFTAG